jgi:hypothetical protein
MQCIPEGTEDHSMARFVQRQCARPRVGTPQKPPAGSMLKGNKIVLLERLGGTSGDRGRSSVALLGWTARAIVRNC